MFRRLDLVYSLDLSLESLSGKFKRKLKAYQVYGTLYIPVSVYLRITASKNMVEHFVRGCCLFCGANRFSWVIKTQLMLNNLKLKLIEDSAGSLRDGAASS